MAEETTIFDKIIAKEIPSKIVYEDDLVLAFHDINPQAQFHCVLIPKKKDGLSQLSKAEDKHKDILGHLMVTVSKIAQQEKLEEGFRVVINDGKKGGQEVFHLHIHILGTKGDQFGWPPGTPGKK
mmetsp:Transcript_10192/g.8742  ORF Transcript_10192/g.8742 Transcript_10192/m.8742 type:complete len:125 (-) Transcript_10192:92-466(-)